MEREPLTTHQIPRMHSGNRFVPACRVWLHSHFSTEAKRSGEIFVGVEAGVPLSSLLPGEKARLRVESASRYECSVEEIPPSHFVGLSTCPSPLPMEREQRDPPPDPSDALGKSNATASRYPLSRYQKQARQLPSYDVVSQPAEALLFVL